MLQRISLIGVPTAPTPPQEARSRRRLVTMPSSLLLRRGLHAGCALLQRPAAAHRMPQILRASRHTLRIHNSEASGEDARLAHRRLLRADSRSHSAAAASAAGTRSPSASGPQEPPRAGLWRRALLSGAAAVALLAAAALPRPATAFQLPGGLFGHPAAAAAAAPAPAAEAAHAMMENRTPLPDLSLLSPEEVQTVTLFKANTPCVVNIANIATARTYYSTDVLKIPQGKETGDGLRAGAPCGSSFLALLCAPCTATLPAAAVPLVARKQHRAGPPSITHTSTTPPRRPGQRVCVGRTRPCRHQLPRHPWGVRGASVPHRPVHLARQNHR